MKRIMRDVVVLSIGANLSLFALAYAAGETQASLVTLGAAALLIVGLLFGSFAEKEEEK
jgi:hypothetical protein